MSGSSRTSGSSVNEVGEMRYRPVACRQDYRLIVVRKNLSVEKGGVWLFDDYRYFFYLTNDWLSSPARHRAFGQPALQPGEPECPVIGRSARLAGAGGQSGEQLGLHGDDGPGLESEGVVGLVAHGNSWAVGGASACTKKTLCYAWNSRPSSTHSCTCLVRSCVPADA